MSSSSRSSLEKTALWCDSTLASISPALRDCLVALLQAPHAKAVSVDLSAVTHIDSSGVATLIEALRIARVHKTQLRLQGLEGRLLRLFGSTGILAMFDADPRNNGECGSRAV